MLLESIYSMFFGKPITMRLRGWLGFRLFIVVMILTTIADCIFYITIW